MFRLKTRAFELRGESLQQVVEAYYKQRTNWSDYADLQILEIESEQTNAAEPLLQKILLQWLPAQMSDISEEAFSAGWYCGLEYRLWHAALAPSDHLGWVSKEQLQQLRFVAEYTGHWIHWEASGKALGPVPIKLDHWRRRYNVYGVARKERFGDGVLNVTQDEFAAMQAVIGKAEQQIPPDAIMQLQQTALLLGCTEQELQGRRWKVEVCKKRLGI